MTDSSDTTENPDADGGAASDVIISLKAQPAVPVEPSDQDEAEERGMTVEQLKQFKTSEGNPYRLLALPMADKIVFDGERLPATYANFLIINKAVLYPTYNQPENDEKAKEVLQKIADGEDFDELSAEYGENPDELFTYNQVAPQFETAAFALSENGISDIVDSAYGYYILKRIPLTEERFFSDFEQIMNLASDYLKERFVDLLNSYVEKINIVK